MTSFRSQTSFAAPLEYFSVYATGIKMLKALLYFNYPTYFFTQCISDARTHRLVSGASFHIYLLNELNSATHANFSLLECR